MTTATMAIVLYWRFRYAMAPSWMALEISCMRSLPAGSLLIRVMRTDAYSAASTPATSPRIRGNCCISSSFDYAVLNQTHEY